MIKIDGNVYKLSTYNGFRGNILFFILPLNPLYVFDLSTFPLIFIIYTRIIK